MLARRSSLQIQKSVVFALLMRELKTRFGKYRLGYAWALLEPVCHVAVLMVIFGWGLARTLSGIDFPVFLLTGIVPWLLFNKLVTQGIACVTANQGLFGYRQVRPFDAMLARIVLEGLVYTATLACLLLVAAWIGLTVTVVDPLQVLAALGLLFVLASGLSMIASIVGTLYEESQKLIPLVLQPLYFISGIFFALEDVPSEYRVYLLWNPILHALELTREGFFASFETGGASWLYLSLVSVTALFTGLALYRQTALRLVTT